MGWKGTLRAVQADMRRREREAQRRQRELDRQRHEYEKMQELERAAYEVEVFENDIELLLSIHKETSEEVEWEWMATADPPPEPMRSNAREQDARQALADYKPSRMDKIRRREEAVRRSLEAAIDEAVLADDEDFQRAQTDHVAAYVEWEETKALAERVLAGDTTAYATALETLGPFHDITELGSGVTFEIPNSDLVLATIHVHSEDVVPKETKSLLKSGKLSVKQMPKGRFYEIHQDYVCGCALRVAREVFAVLPVNTAVVTAVDTMLNPATGHLEEQPILSVAIPRTTLDRLNLALVDPSDSMSNFVHNMAFKKTQGFAPVERVDPASLDL